MSTEETDTEAPPPRLAWKDCGLRVVECWDEEECKLVVVLEARRSWDALGAETWTRVDPETDSPHAVRGMLKALAEALARAR
jgi:hypothetical protein